MKEKIMKWYQWGLWTESMVIDASDRGIITPIEVDEILGGEED